MDESVEIETNHISGDAAGGGAGQEYELAPTEATEQNVATDLTEQNVATDLTEQNVATDLTEPNLKLISGLDKLNMDHPAVAEGGDEGPASKKSADLMEETVTELVATETVILFKLPGMGLDVKSRNPVAEPTATETGNVLKLLDTGLELKPTDLVTKPTATETGDILKLSNTGLELKPTDPVMELKSPSSVVGLKSSDSAIELKTSDSSTEIKSPVAGSKSPDSVTECEGSTMPTKIKLLINNNTRHLYEPKTDGVQTQVLNPMPPLNEGPDLTLTKKQATELVKRRLSQDQSMDDLEALVTALKFHMIPLQLATAYLQNDLRDNPKQIKAYLELLDQVKEFSYDNLTLTEIENATYQVFRITLGRILQDSLCHLKPILVGLSCFYSKNIPVQIFESMEESGEPENVRAAIEMLKKYSIVRIDSETKTLNIHPLVQHAIWLNLTPEEIQDGLFIMLKILSKKFDPEAIDRNLAKPFLPHAEYLWCHAMKFRTVVAEFGYFPIRVCRELQYFEYSEEVIRITQCSLACVEEAFGNLTVPTTCLKYLRAWALGEKQMFAESWDLLTEIRPRCSPEQGLPHGLVVMILYLHVTHLEWQGNYTRKFEVLEEIEAIQVKEAGPKHPSTLQTLHNKAIVLHKLGKETEALKLFRRVHKLRKQVLGVDHFFTQLTKKYIDQIVNSKPLV